MEYTKINIIGFSIGGLKSELQSLEISTDQHFNGDFDTTTA